METIQEIIIGIAVIFLFAALAFVGFMLWYITTPVVLFVMIYFYSKSEDWKKS